MLFYLLAYAAMTLGVFAVIVSVSTPERPLETVDDLAGLARTRPGAAFAMAIFLFSLTGIPLTAGFWGKLTIFSSAIASGDSRYTWLAVVGVVNAAISSYYYLRIIGVMYMQESEEQPGTIELGPLSTGIIGIAVAGTLFLGLFWGPVISIAQKATFFFAGP